MLSCIVEDNSIPQVYYYKKCYIICHHYLWSMFVYWKGSMNCPIILKYWLSYEMNFGYLFSICTFCSSSKAHICYYIKIKIQYYVCKAYIQLNLYEQKSSEYFIENKFSLFPILYLRVMLSYHVLQQRDFRTGITQ